MTAKKLTKTQISEFQNRLLELRAELTGHIADTSHEVKEGSQGKGYTQHQADEGTDDFDRTLSLQLSSSEQDVLRLIDRALEKIEDSTYGVCDLSGEPIPIVRLEAIPYATMTREAQEKWEKGQV